MKDKLEKAKKLLKDGDILQSLQIVKSISDEMRNAIQPCPNCGEDTTTLIKNDMLILQCPNCKAISGNIYKNANDIKEISMKKNEVIDKLWAMYKAGDTDIAPYDINSFELTGYLKKSLSDKLDTLTKEQGEALTLSEKDVPSQHQLKIARSTMKMHCAGASVAGGMDHKEAARLLGTSVPKGCTCGGDSCMVEKSVDMEKSKKSPFEWKAEHAGQYGPGKGAYPFPNLGTDKIKGYKHIQDHFVDKTGMDNDGPALSHASFHAKLTPGKAYAITDEGQFQVHVGEFEKEPKKIKKSEDEVVTLSKNQMINMLMDMLKKGEEPKLVSANVITKLDIANELDMTVEKMLYEKAGLEYDSLRKDKGKEWVSRKIKYLMENEGKTQKQAVGQALGMARQKGLVKADELTEADLSKVEITGDAPPEAGGSLRRPRPLSEAPGLKKPMDKKPEDKKITPAKSSINLHMPSNADIHVHIGSDKEKPAMKLSPMSEHIADKKASPVDSKSPKVPSVLKSEEKGSMCKGCGMLLKDDTKHVCKSEIKKADGDKKRVARWSSKSGKHWVDMHQHSDGNYSYDASNGGGNLGVMDYSEAVKRMQSKVDMGGFQPDANKSPMKFEEFKDIEKK